MTHCQQIIIYSLYYQEIVQATNCLKFTYVEYFSITKSQKIIVYSCKIHESYGDAYSGNIYL